MQKIPRLIIDSSERSSDLRYACAFRTTGDAIVCLRQSRRCILVVPAMERERAEKALCGSHDMVFTPGDFALEQRDRRRVGVWSVALLRHLRIKRVKVADDFPVEAADCLRRNNITVDLASGRLFPEREVKSLRELNACRESQRAAVVAMRTVVDIIRETTVDVRSRLWHDGRILTSEIMRDHMESVLLSRSCTCADTIVACGADSALPHHRGTGPLHAGKAIVVDVFPRHRGHGYHGDLTRTLVRGAVPARLRKMLRAVRQAHAAALGQVRAGVSAAAVHGAAEAVFCSMGMCTENKGRNARGFIHATGHGVGLDIHEPPWVGNSKKKLRSGQVITIEPGWYEPGYGGVRIEDTVEVTGFGYKVLARYAAVPSA